MTWWLKKWIKQRLKVYLLLLSPIYAMCYGVWSTTSTQFIFSQLTIYDMLRCTKNAVFVVCKLTQGTRLVQTRIKLYNCNRTSVKFNYHWNTLLSVDKSWKSEVEVLVRVFVIVRMSWCFVSFDFKLGWGVWAHGREWNFKTAFLKSFCQQQTKQVKVKDSWRNRTKYEEIRKSRSRSWIVSFSSSHGAWARGLK